MNSETINGFQGDDFEVNPKGFKRSVKAFGLFLLFVALVCPDVSGQTNKDRYGVYEIQAAFLYNFLDFVEWPDRNTPPSDTIAIGVLGVDPFGDVFKPIEGKTVGGKVVTIKKSSKLEVLKGCRIIFIAGSEKDRLETVVDQLDGLPVLTVSDMDDFTDRGGIIGFYTVEVKGQQKIRFEINKDRADASGLKISYKLLNIAKKRNN